MKDEHAPVLVDTHAALWLTQKQNLLSKAASRTIVQGRDAGVLCICDITLREIAMLVAGRRITIDRPLDLYLQFLEAHFRVIAMNAEIAARSVRFGPKYPRDPADQIIGATTIVLSGRLITKDKLIRNSNEVSCIW